jgi:hypothetical protein
VTKSQAPLPLFEHADIRRLEAERERLAKALKRMRAERRRGAILRTEFRLRQITGRILAASQGKEFEP